ncbi:hypothetical protein LTR36_009123 [Oleoguttula mirabilis]|uniref:Cell cycle control protein n=1 Tax=Oleoguttula mirabilis TaxID=1507867 RepID=A0AAV9J7B1_9PEZI|nr:hypothetical protein LTR36_009123 [Oleoguttula mirabilis]
MGLEDFEKGLAASTEREPKRRSHRDRDEDGERKHHRHHHRSHRHGDEPRDEERRHRHKRPHDREDDYERRHKKRQRSDSPKPETKAEEDVKVFDSDGGEDDDWVEKEADTAPPGEPGLDERLEDLGHGKVQRDAWMEEPSALDIDYVQRRKQKSPPSQFVSAKQGHELKVHEAEASQHLADLQRDFDSDGEEEEEGHEKVEHEEAQHEVSYTFGDAASSWRMTKLKAVYRQAEEKGQTVDDVAVERYGDLRDFDDAREEEREMDRRKMYGKAYVGLQTPSGELFQERKMQAGLRREADKQQQEAEQRHLPQGDPIPDAPVQTTTTAPLDQTALNKLKAQLMKARLRNAPNAAQLEEEYNRAASAGLAASQAQPGVVMLSNMDNRQLAGDRSGEVTAVTGKRGRERGLVTENEDMSIEEMVKHEKRTRGGGGGGGEGKGFAERIAKDAKFENDLEYMDDNAAKLSRKVVQSDVHLRSTAIGDFQKMQRILDACPLCHHDEVGGAGGDSDVQQQQQPTAPIVSLATRTYLTLPPEPEIARGGAVIVPIQHRLNLLECDDDEWEELRNFMKALTRYYDARDLGVLFYENAAHMHSRKGHATLNAIPLPRHLAANAPAYFREAVLSSDEQWAQHKPLIDTLALSQKAGGFGKAAFRKSMVKEMPYFHVFFTLDGGLGHVVEDERRWPKGDLFAREVVGGMLDRGPEVVRRQGGWERGGGGERRRRVEGFRKGWARWDWTVALLA